METMLTMIRYNSDAAIKHERNLRRHMQQVHGHRKDQLLGVSKYHSRFVSSGFLYQPAKASPKTSGDRGESGSLQDDVEIMQRIRVPMVQWFMRRIWRRWCPFESYRV